jgi:hypothetical protein
MTVLKTWKLASNKNMTIELCNDGYYYMTSCKGTRSALVNRLDSMTADYQLRILREIGQPETDVK